MEGHSNESNIPTHVLQEGWTAIFVVGFTVACTLWLLISRMRGCFQPRPPMIGRDLAFLLCGPVSAILYAAVRAMAATRNLFLGPDFLDAEFSITIGFPGVMNICGICYACFVVGVIAHMLPMKSATKAEPP